MKTKTVYLCEFCHSEYETSKEVYECEAKHLGLTLEEYKEYKSLLDEEKRAFSEAASSMNERIDKRCNDAVKAVIEFQKKHGFVDCVYGLF